MTFKERIDALAHSGQLLQQLLNAQDDVLEAVLEKAWHHNNWFDPQHSRFALSQIAKMLEAEALEQWLKPYQITAHGNSKPLRIGVIMAGNIPLVGFHDFLCVLVTGHTFLGKLSSQDSVLWHFMADLLIRADKRLKEKFRFVENLRDGFDAVIATGSDNTSRYFDYYFGRYPHIIRHNRNSAAVLDGNESMETLESLASDICLYYGRGCRSVSKIFVPQGYCFDALKQALKNYSHFELHNKLYNNYEYRKAIMMLNAVPFEDAGFMMITENSSFASPVAVLHYNNYNSLDEALNELSQNIQNLQCVVSTMPQISGALQPGTTQTPSLNDYADNIDTVQFLLNQVQNVS